MPLRKLSLDCLSKFGRGEAPSDNSDAHQPFILRNLHKLALAACLPLLMSASHTSTTLETILEQGQLTIISRPRPTTFYEGRQGFDGYEYNLAKAFADSLGVELKIVEEENFSNIFNAVGTQRGALAAAGLSVSEEHADTVRFTNPYMTVSQDLLYRSGTKRPSSIDELYGKSILVISNSAHAERLRQLQQLHPELRWHEQSDLEMIDLIEMVDTGVIDYAVVDSNSFKLNRNLYPRARKAFAISDEAQSLAWAFPKSPDNTLYDLANDFLAQAEEDGLLAEMNARYYGDDHTMDTGSATTFARRLENRLPRWQEPLQSAAEEFDLDWQLLAAISYQESHWDPQARSRTGVRGLMMLTQITAKEVGVSNRLDPQQSIYGGAKYVRKLYDRMPESIQGDDRTWLTLAAYNIGFGHLEDARVLTQRMGGDPDKWVDVSQHLPLLAKPQYYRSTRHGYARGWEPVEYVQNIRSFYTTIAWHQQVQQRRLANASTEAEMLPINASYKSSDTEATTML